MDMSSVYGFFPGFPNIVIDILGLLLMLSGILVCIGLPWVVLSFFANDPRSMYSASMVAFLYVILVFMVFLTQYTMLTFIISAIIALFAYIRWWFGNKDRIKKKEIRDIDLFE